MNINNVYVAKICVRMNEDDASDYTEGMIFVYRQSAFVKDALVYEDLESITPRYIDLETGKEYIKFNVCNAHIGELYIKMDDGLIPYSSLIETNKKNMSKRKILKNYNNSIKGNNK